MNDSNSTAERLEHRLDLLDQRLGWVEAEMPQRFEDLLQRKTLNWMTGAIELLAIATVVVAVLTAIS